MKKLGLEAQETQNEQEVITDWERLPLVLSRAKVGEILGICLNNVDILFNRSGFPVVTIGRRKLVSKEAFRKYINQEGEQ